MVLPQELLSRFYEKLAFYSGTVSNFEKYTLASFMEEGKFETHINRLRNYYRLKKDALLELCQKQIEEGEDLSEALRSTGIFSGVYAQMASIGSKTGSMEQVMERLAKLYQDDIDNRMNNALAVLEPTLVIVLSLIVGIILLSVMLPLTGIMSRPYSHHPPAWILSIPCGRDVPPLSIQPVIQPFPSPRKNSHYNPAAPSPPRTGAPGPWRPQAAGQGR